MLGSDFNIGDILEGKNCGLTRTNAPELFRIVSIVKSKDSDKYCILTLTRLHDDQLMNKYTFYYNLENWRVVKRNNRTVCQGCKK